MLMMGGGGLGLIGNVGRNWLWLCKIALYGLGCGATVIIFSYLLRGIFSFFFFVFVLVADRINIIIILLCFGLVNFCLYTARV